MLGSPFLNISFTVAYLSLSGKTPFLRAALKIWVRGEIMKGRLNLIILIDISL
jgi:hypothetical protein